MTVDPAIADWLKAEALFTAANDPALAARWGASAANSETVSPLALADGAVREAARQLGFLSGPLAIDTHLVPGLQRALLGRPVTITADRLGYTGGVVVFVIGYEEQAGPEMTVLKVLRRL